MRDTGKQPSKPIKPSPNPSALPSDQENGEGSYVGTRNYQTSLKGYLESANVEQDARDAAPENAAEARDMEKAEQAGRKHVIKKPLPPKGK